MAGQLLTVLVCGGRDYSGKDAVWHALEELAKEHFDANGGETDRHGNWMPLDGFSVVHGGCNCGPGEPMTGADFWANEWCTCNWVTPRVFYADWYPDWRTLDRSAGPKRNQQMLDESKPDLVLAFPGGNGTADMVRRARKGGYQVREIAA